LFDAFFEELEGLTRQIGRGPIVIVQNTSEHVDQVDADANAAALL